MTETNSSKRLPIVFCLDVSPSMRWSKDSEKPAIELLNAAIRQFINELKQNNRALNSAEIAFVTFSSEAKLYQPLTPLANLNVPVFSTVERGWTNLSEAVILAMEELRKRRSQLDDLDIAYYAPFLVIVTDGDPDETDNPTAQAKALSLIEQHCHDGVKLNELVIPFVIGVGDRVNPTILNKYAQVFADGFLHIKGNGETREKAFFKVFELIINSAFVSFHTNPRETFKMVRMNVNQLLEDMAGIL